MNKNGFAISGLIYTVLIIFIVILFSILSLMSSRKNVLDTLKLKVLGDVNNSTLLNYDPFTKSGEVLEFKAKAKGYYSFELYSPKLNNVNGSMIKTELFLNKGEILYILVGSNNYNNGNTEVRYDKDNANSTIIKASSLSSVANYDGREFLNTIIKNKSVTDTSGKVVVQYLNKKRQNNDLNKIRYIKDCINGNSSNKINTWSEIKAISEGKNVALGKININNNLTNNSNLTDGNFLTSATGNNKGEECVIVDLEKTYNLDYIIINHSSDVTYYGSKTYVSMDNVNYVPIRLLEEKETSLGLTVDAFSIKQVELVGNVYVPVKEQYDAIWLRMYHHNNLSGTVMWSSISQPILEGGIDDLHKQSILYSLENYRNSNNQFEFLLEYSDLSGYNRWVQTSNPLKTSESVSGYKKIKLSWEDNGFKGLAKSNYGKTLLDGSVGSGNWFYSIGATQVWNGGIPGPNTSIKGSTDLWVRIDNIR